MTRKFGLILCFFCFSFALFAQNEDCPIAKDLVDTRTDLSNGFTLIVDPLTGPGQPDSVFRICNDPMDVGGYFSPEGKSFWFSFKAATTGTFEMLITPDGLAGDFDFMIWEGDCPSNPCAVPIFCAWLESGTIVPTGLSSDPNLFNSNLQIWEPITLKENTNYFVLLDHREPLCPPLSDPFKDDCDTNPIPYLDIGCEVEFGGTAIIEPTKEAPRLEPIFPQDTTQIVPICVGTSTSFRVDLLNFDEAVDYIWTSPSGDTLPSMQEDGDFIIQQSGQVCVEILCPIQEIICWDVDIVQPPQLRRLDPVLTSCTPLTIEDYVEDVNMAPGFFDLLDEQFQVIDISNLEIRGEYTIRKSNGACIDSERITTTPPSPKLVPNGFGTCDGPQFDLTTIIDQIEETNGYKDNNNLNIFFYADSSQAVIDDTPITMTNGFGQYWAKGSNDNDCSDIVPIEIFDATPDIATPTIPAACNQFDLSSVELRTASDIPILQNQIMYFSDLADVGDPSRALVNSMVMNSGIYYAQITINPTCATNIPLDVLINQSPTIEPIMDVDFCNSYNLEDVNVVETNGITIDKEYFSSETEANAIPGTPINSVVNVADTYWIKATDPASNCFSIVSVTLNTNEPTINPITAVDECGDAFDLNTILPNLTEATGTILDYTFYLTQAEAEAGTSAGITNVTSSDTYYVRGENRAIMNSTCFDVSPVQVTLTMPNIRAFPEQKIENGSYDLSDLLIINLDNPSQSITAAGYYRDSLLTQALPSPIVMEQDTYWIEIIIGTCSIPRPIIVRPESDATFDKETLPLEFPCVKTDGIDLPLTLSGTTGVVDTDNFDIAFFKNEEDAEKGINPIVSADLVIFNEGSIWIRKTDKTDTNIFGLIELVITERAIAEGGIISMDQEICAEDVLEFEFSGAAPFDIRYTDGTDTFDLVIPSTGLFEEAITPSGETTYELVSLKDSHGCDGLFVDNTPTFTPVPIAILNLDAVCDDQETTYTVSFDIVSGDLPTIDIDLDGAIVGNQFISDPIPIMDGYSLTITDKNHIAGGNCEPLTVTSVNPPICTCDTEAAEMDQRAIDACVGETITAIIDQDAVLADNNDRTVYVLHDSDTEELGNIIDRNNDAPEFTLTPDLAGGRYYISAVSTIAADLPQTPELQVSENRCLTVAVGTPVDVRAIPTVNLNLERETICFGETIDLTFELPDAGPYNLSFFDGNTTVDLTNVRNGDTESVSAEIATTFEVTSISYSDLSSCINDLPEATATLEVFEPITIQNRMVNCEEDGENFTISFEILGGDPSSYSVNGSTANINGNLFTSDLIENETNYNFDVSDANGCLVAEVTDFGKCDCTSDISTNIEILQEISCVGESDAIVRVNGINGEPPYSFEWSNGIIAEQLNGLGAGLIYVSMTDANLCEVIDSIELTSPDPITAMVNTSDPSCADLENGSIVVNNVQGGTRPYSYSINGESAKSVGLFANLSGREYEIVIEDAEGCILEESATINTPTPLNIWFDESGYNLVFGDSLALRVNANEDSLRYAWQNHPSLSCTNCSSPIIRPTETTNYSVTVTNQNDCTISREILVEVDNTKGLYLSLIHI